MGAAEKLDIDVTTPLKDSFAKAVEGAVFGAQSVINVVDAMKAHGHLEPRSDEHHLGWCVPLDEQRAFLDEMEDVHFRLTFLQTPAVRHAVRRVHGAELARSFDEHVALLLESSAASLKLMQAQFEANATKLRELAAKPQDPVFTRIMAELGDRDDEVVMTFEEFEVWSNSGANFPEDRCASST